VGDQVGGRGGKVGGHRNKVWVLTIFSKSSITISQNYIFDLSSIIFAENGCGIIGEDTYLLFICPLVPLTTFLY
jgi:hypothetical protein